MNMIPEIPDKTVHLGNGYYHGVYVMLHFNNKDSFDRKLKHADVEPDPDDEDMEDVKLDDEMELHWRMVFEYND